MSMQNRARRIARFALPVLLLAAGACATARVREVDAQRSAVANEGDVLVRPVTWRAPERLVFASPVGEGALRYGVDWFATPGSPPLTRAELVFGGLADDLADEPADSLRGRVVVLLLPSVPIEEMSTSAAWAQTVADSAGARGVLFVLPPAFDSTMVRASADDMEEASRADETFGMPAWFVRYEPLVAAAATADLDLPVLVRAAVRGDIGAAPLDGFHLSIRTTTAPPPVIRTASRQKR